MKYLITDRDFFTILAYSGLYLVKKETLTITQFCNNANDANLINLLGYEITEFVNRLCKTTLKTYHYTDNARIRENDDIIVIRILSRIQDLTAEDLIELNNEKLVEYYKIEIRRLW